jgi:aerobic carbon-monoxide dehydrogenase small subunit
MTGSGKMAVEFSINGRAVQLSVEPRRLLSDVLREELGLNGTHVGCEHGVCGACTIWLDEAPARACLLFAVQVGGRRLTTVEGLSPDGALTPLQRAFQEAHAVQCGFCTPGMLMTIEAMLRSGRRIEENDIRDALAGHLCRCTGYQNILRAVRRAAGLAAP